MDNFRTEITDYLDLAALQPFSNKSMSSTSYQIFSNLIHTIYLVFIHI